MAAIPARFTIRGPSMAAYSAGITGVPLSQRNAPLVYSISGSNAKGRAWACHPVNAGSSRSRTAGAT